MKRVETDAVHLWGGQSDLFLTHCLSEPTEYSYRTRPHLPPPNPLNTSSSSSSSSCFSSSALRRSSPATETVENRYEKVIDPRVPLQHLTSGNLTSPRPLSSSPSGITMRSQRCTYELSVTSHPHPPQVAAHFGGGCHA